jgi:flagellar motor switch protein FliG
MAKNTKAEQKRLIESIISKTKRMFLQLPSTDYAKVSVKDVEVIERICAKWLKRMG